MHVSSTGQNPAPGLWILPDISKTAIANIFKKMILSSVVFRNGGEWNSHPQMAQRDETTCDAYQPHPEVTNQWVW
jgi:hypothetical protein